MDTVRFTAAELGMHYPASGEVLWDPRDGSPANQYVASVRVYSELAWLPVALRVLRDLGYSSVRGLAVSMMRDVIGKFTIVYILRPLTSGGPYFFHANYLWDLPHHVFGTLRYYLLSKSKAYAGNPLLTQDLLSLLDLHVEDGEIKAGDPTHTPLPHQPGGKPTNEGLLRADMEFTPLTEEQLSLLQSTHDAHMMHVDAVHDRNYDDLPTLGRQVVQAHLALEATAITVNDQVLLTLPLFNGQIDPRRWLDGSVDDFFTAADAAHATWMSAVMQRDIVEATKAGLQHLRNHALIGYEQPDVVVREVCDDYIGNCPVTGDPA